MGNGARSSARRRRTDHAAGPSPRDPSPHGGSRSGFCRRAEWRRYERIGAGDSREFLGRARKGKDSRSLAANKREYYSSRSVTGNDLPNPSISAGEVWYQTDVNLSIAPHHSNP